MQARTVRIGLPRPRTGRSGATIPAVVVSATVELPCADFRIAARMNGKKAERESLLAEKAKLENEIAAIKAGLGG